MKKINVVCGNNFNDVNVMALSFVDKTKKNIIIVPDRSSLIMEKTIFNSLGITACFNIDVMGISRFAKKIFAKAKKEFNLVSKTESVLLIRKALKNKQKNLKVFKGEINSGLCNEVFENISQLFSNNITSQMLECGKEKLSKGLAQRLEDLNILKEEYSSLLGENVDSTKMLEILDDYIKKEEFEDTNIFFLNYDSLTEQGYQILESLSQTKANLFIGAILPENQKNKFVFENDIFFKLNEMQNKKLVEIEKINASCSLKSFSGHINRNLFALNPEKFPIKNSFFELRECAGLNEEILEVAREINYLLLSGKCKYQNIAVACGDLATASPLIERVFSEFGFSFFIDKSFDIKQTQTFDFLMSVLACFQYNFNTLQVEKLMLNDMCELNVNQKSLFYRMLEKYNFHGDSLFHSTQNKFPFDDNLAEFDAIKDEIFSKLKTLKQKLKKAETVQNYCDFVLEIIQVFNLEEKTEKLLENFVKTKNILLEKVYVQVLDKTKEALASLNFVLGEEKVGFEEFLDLFGSLFESMEISTVPISVDSIFVADATDGFFEEVEHLFVIGANQSILPRSINDSSILNDSILEKISSVAKINPTVKMINRRNRFKLLCLFQLARTKIFMTYSTIDKTGKKLLLATFASDLEKIFGSKENYELADEDEKTAFEFAKKMGNLSLARREIFRHKESKSKKEQELYNALFQQVNTKDIDFSYLDNYSLSESAENLFFKKNKTSVSQVEKYYECPFKNFANNVLKIRSDDNFQLQNFDNGNILHKVAEEFLDKHNGYITALKTLKENLERQNILSNERIEDKFLLEQIKFNKLAENVWNGLSQKIEQIVEEIFSRIENLDKFYKLKIKENKDIKHLLKRESVRFCCHLFLTQTISKFKPEFTEARFGSQKFPAYKFKVRDKEINLVGVVDRIDTYQDMFIVMDYKSGGKANGSLGEIYYAEKIQIFVYLYVLEKILNKRGCGAYYFPVKNMYEEDNAKNYLLLGQSLLDEQFLNAMDDTISFEDPSSRIFKCKISTSKKNIENGKKEYSKSYAVEQDALDSIKNYSMLVVKKSIEEMLDKNILPCPFGNACSFCDFNAFCGKNKKTIKRNKPAKIKKEFFTKIKFEEN